MYRIAIAILIIIMLIKPISIIYERRGAFFGRGFMKQFSVYKNAYDTSQYVNKNNPSIIPDETFEAFAGGAFLQGTNPIHIVHEHPPLGRYIIALSILLFDNASTLILPLMIFSILGIFLIAYSVLKNILYALIPVGIFLNEPLVLGKFQFTPLLEPIQLPFIVFALYFFMKATKETSYTRWFILTSIMLGAVISIRFFILGLFLVFAMGLYLLVSDKISKRTIAFVFSLPLALIVLIFSYTKTIQEGYSILQIFGVQKYIFFYHQSKFINLFSFWDLLLFNRWHTWWADRAIISDAQWILAWPIATVLIAIYTILALVKKVSMNKAELIVLLWIIMYSLLLSVGNTTTRYFLPLAPFLYILAISFLVKVFILKKNKDAK